MLSSSWILGDGKCTIHPFELTLPPRGPDAPGRFGHASFSARGPRPRFRANLMNLAGSRILGRFRSEPSIRPLGYTQGHIPHLFESLDDTFRFFPIQAVWLSMSDDTFRCPAINCIRDHAACNANNYDKRDRALGKIGELHLAMLTMVW